MEQDPDLASLRKLPEFQKIVATQHLALTPQALREPPRCILIRCAPVAQLDRASGFEPEGREFESLRARLKLAV
jgi:hypothetical protein